MMKTGGILKTRHNVVNETVELLVFGYQSKLYRDDARASEFDRESHLIPAPYDNNVLLSRYDVRATLDVAPQENDNMYLNRLECLSQAEQQAEAMAEKERYHSLYLNEVEEEIQQEEQLKRQAAEYNQIPFNYDEIGPKISADVTDEPEEVDKTPFESKIELPDNVVPPDTLKQHQIIEKTAKFIASQGAQMEILLKTKQASNAQFNFLSHDGQYNAYYKHILSLMKNGSYQFHAETETKKDEDDQKATSALVEEPEPTTSAIIIPKLAFKPSADCAYTQLISKITKAPISAIEQKQKDQEANATNGSTGIKSLGLLASYCSDSEDSQDDEEDANYSGSIPSNEIQIVIDKTALYVAKNGRDFEETLKKKNGTRFQFLTPNDEFHAYYLFKVNECRKSLPASSTSTASTKLDTRKPIESTIAVVETAKSSKIAPKTPVSFSIKPKDDKSQMRVRKAPPPLDETAESQSPKKISVEEELEMQVDVMNAEREERLAREKLKGKLFTTARKNLVGMPKEKILQIERKKKALMFVNQIKGSNSNGGNGNGNNEVINLTTCNDDESDSSVKSIPMSSSSSRSKRLSRSRSRKRSSRSSSSSRSRASRHSSSSSGGSSRRRHKKSKSSRRRKSSKHRRRTRSRSRSRSRSNSSRRKNRNDRRDRRH